MPPLIFFFFFCPLVIINDQEIMGLHDQSHLQIVAIITENKLSR